MTVKEYERALLEKLTEEFKDKCYDKLGYRPIVRVIQTIVNDIISLEELESIINEFIPQDFKKKYKITNIKSNFRNRELSDLRHIYAQIARSMGYTFYAISRYLNKRDHSTIINSCKRFNQLYAYDDLFADKYDNIINKINKYIDGNKLLQSVDQKSVDSKSTLSTVLL